MAGEGRAVVGPVRADALHGEVRHGEHEGDGEQKLHRDQAPLRLRGLRFRTAHGASPLQVRDDGDHKAAERGAGAAEQLHHVAEEGHQLRDEPRGRQRRDHDGAPLGPASHVVLIAAPLVAVGVDGAAQDDALQQVGDEHVQEQAGGRHLQAAPEGDIVEDHAVGVAPEVVVAPETADQQHEALERRGDQVGLREVRGVLHLRDDLRNHELGGEGEGDLAQARHAARKADRRHSGVGATVADPLLRASSHHPQRDPHGPDDREDVEPDEGLVRPHAARRHHKGQEQDAAQDGPLREADVDVVHRHS
mmetsp:Transcript_5349/g.11187  ORF Transcript_5349/g.11187 Transcript_5349/m.11187 type:complete len:306 (-) Transcript_5349:610-1527(-)